MEPAIGIGPATRDLLPNIIQLGASHYAKDHPALRTDYLAWLYLKNPAGPAKVVSATEGASWMGMIALIPVRLAVNDRVQDACYAIHVLSHPAHRGKSLFAKMISHAKQVLADSNVWLIGHPNTPSTPGWTRQHMHFRPPLAPYLAPLRNPLGGYALAPLADKPSLLSLPPSIWKLPTNDGIVRVRHDPDFIYWRYLQAPARKYSLTCVSSKQGPIAIYVTRPFKGPLRLAVHWSATPSLPKPVFSTVTKPTLIMYPEAAQPADGSTHSPWRLPLRRRLPFFATTWTAEAEPPLDFSGVTLAASDF